MIVKDFIQELRDTVGDTSNAIPTRSIITFLNTVLRRIARTDGLERLLDHHDTFELASINKDGTPSASWDLGKVGVIIDIRSFRLLKSGPVVKEIHPKYVEYDDFFLHNTLPELCTPGDPSEYTIEQIGSLNKLIFDRPPKDLVALDMIYSAFHPRIESVDDEIQIAYSYCDVLLEYVVIRQKQSADDNSVARANYEDLDLLITELVNLLAKRKTALPYRRVRRSF